MKLAIAALGWLSVLASAVQAEGEPLDLEGLLQPEVVLATKRAQGIWEAPAVIDVIGRADLRRRGYRSVAEALRFLPGFQISDDYLMPSVSIRGIHNGQRAWSRMLKVMLDGQAVPFRPEASNWLGPEFMPLELIERIEVIRGPGSALYGADAFLGVVNVVTRRGEEIAGSYLTGKAGTWLHHPQAEAGLITGYPTPWNTEWVAAAQWSQFDRNGLTPHPQSPALAGLDDPVTRRDHSSPLSLYVRADALETPIGQWRADALFQHLDTSGEFYDTRPLTHATRLVADNRHLRGHWRQDWSPQWSTQLALSHADAGPGSGDSVSLGRTDYDLIRRFRAVGWDLAVDTAYLLDERDFVSLGADFNLTDQQLPTYYRAYAANHPRAGEWELMGEPGDAHRFLNLGVFGQGVLHPWDTTSLTVGLRHDWHNIYGSVFNARAALVNQWSDNLSGKLLYGSSFKAPSPQQLFGRPLVYGDILGNPDLKPERAQTLEVAVDFLPERWWSLHANTYLTHVSDALRFVTQAGNPKAVNEAQIIAGGLEASTRLQRGDWLMETNLTVQRASVEEAAPTFTANLALGAPLDPAPFTLYAECRFMGSLPSTQSNFAANGHVAYRLPASAIADVTLSSRDLALLGGETYLTLKVENLLDSSYATPGFGGLDYPGRGRHLWLSITQGF